MNLQRRIQIGLLLLMVLLLVIALFAGAWEVRGVKSCLLCGSREPFVEKSYWVMGVQWEEEIAGSFQPSVLCKDFPYFSCDHDWERESDGRAMRQLWPNPLLKMADVTPSGMARNQLAMHYNAHPAFRTELHRLLESGVVSHARLYQLLQLNCMDGGQCALSSGSPEDAAVLQLVEGHGDGK